MYIYEVTIDWLTIDNDGGYSSDTTCSGINGEYWKNNDDDTKLHILIYSPFNIKIWFTNLRILAVVIKKSSLSDDSVWLNTSLN